MKIAVVPVESRYPAVAVVPAIVVTTAVEITIFRITHPVDSDAYKIVFVGSMHNPVTLLNLAAVPVPSVVAYVLLPANRVTVGPDTAILKIPYPAARYTLLEPSYTIWYGDDPATVVTRALLVTHVAIADGVVVTFEMFEMLIEPPELMYNVVPIKSKLR